MDEVRDCGESLDRIFVEEKMGGPRDFEDFDLALPQTI
jgi:hypothetical protein